MCKELAKELRNELKELGYNRNMVSITSDYNSINVNIKSIDVDFKKVAELANNYKKIDRDHSGDILQGGNIFVSIEYAENLMESLENKYMSKAQETFEAIQNSNELENMFIKDGIHAFLGDFQMIWFRVPQADGTTKRYKCYNCVEGIAEVFARLFLNEKIDILETSKPVQEVLIVEQIKIETENIIQATKTQEPSEALESIKNQLAKVTDTINNKIDINDESIRLPLRDIENNLKYNYCGMLGMMNTEELKRDLDEEPQQENKIKVTHNEYENIAKELASRIYAKDETKLTMKEYERLLDNYDILPFQINTDNEELKNIINTYADNETIEVDRTIYRGSIDKSILYDLYQNKGYSDLYLEYYQMIICKDELKVILTYCEGDFIAEVYNSIEEYNMGIEKIKQFIEEM